MKTNKKTQELIENSIKEAIENLITEEGSSLITDVYISVSPETGEVLFFDDNDEILSTCTINGFETRNNNKNEFYNALDNLISPILNRMNSEGLFKDLPIVKPFSFVLVDENKDTYTELLLIDDDTLIISDELLKGLDEELDLFLKELLEN